MYYCISTEWLCNIFVYLLLQVKHHKAMVCNGCRYRIKKLDEKKKTSYCGISAVFEVINVSSRNDRHPELSQNRYYGYLEDILQCDFNLRNPWQQETSILCGMVLMWLSVY